MPDPTTEPSAAGESSFEAALTTFRPTDAELAALAENASPILAVKDATIEDLHAARMPLKNARVAIEKTRKALKEDALRFGRAVDAEAKRLTQIVEPVERKIEQRQRAIEEEIAAAKRREEEAAFARALSWADRYRAVGVSNPAAWYRERSDEELEAGIAEAEAEFRRKEAEAAAARARAEAAAAEERARAEFEARAAKERREAEERAERDAREKALVQENLRLAAERAEREKELEAERARIAEERRALAEQQAEVAKQRAQQEEEARRRAAAEAAEWAANVKVRAEENAPTIERIEGFIAKVQELLAGDYALPPRASAYVQQLFAQLRQIAESGRKGVDLNA